MRLRGIRTRSAEWGIVLLTEREPIEVVVCALALMCSMVWGVGCGTQSGLTNTHANNSSANGSGTGSNDGSNNGTGQYGTAGTCPADPDVTGVTINANYDNGVRIGRSDDPLPITAILEVRDGASAAGITACWTSSDPSILTVTATGDLSCTISGRAAGTATLTASVGDTKSEPLTIRVVSGSTLPGTP